MLYGKEAELMWYYCVVEYARYTDRMIKVEKACLDGVLDIQERSEKLKEFIEPLTELREKVSKLLETAIGLDYDKIIALHDMHIHITWNIERLENL